MKATALALTDQIALLSGSDFWFTQDLPTSGVPKVQLCDGPHGLRSQRGASDHLGLAASTPATCFPPAVTMASTWDTNLVEQVGKALAVEANAQGVAVILGPGLNIKRSPLCGRNFEYFSEDPLLSGHLAAAMVTGIQYDDSVGACLKHFAVNNQERNRFVTDAIVDERTLRELYLRGFEYAVQQARPWAVMAAYNFVNGLPCTAHPHLLQEILRDEWGFDGLLMSDWGATTQRPQSVAAGMDLEMPSSAGLYDHTIAAAVAEGTLPVAAVTTSAQRVLDLVEKSPRPQLGGFPVESHDRLARQAAVEGTVLLTNDGVLPLHRSKSVALIGAFAATPRFQGAGSSQVNPTRLTTAVDAFAELGWDVRYAPGYEPSGSEPDQALIDEAVAIAKQADVAVVLAGLPGRHESEGFDREHLDLPTQHNDLIAAVAAVHPRTVVALSNGAPVLMPWKDDVAAIVESYLGGQACGGALVDVLTGSEPGGRLAETFPASLDDVAASAWFPGSPHQVEYREGLFVGYRHATTAELPVLFPFGHGLSYTRFAWEEISVESAESIQVHLTVTNVGSRPGSDVVQVYVHDRSDVVVRPRRVLAGWAKVKLTAGEVKRVEIALDPRAFAFYDVEQRRWRTLAGGFSIEVARSSTDIVQTFEVSVPGEAATAPASAKVAPIASADADFAALLGRPIPTPRPMRPFTLDSTLEEIGETLAGRLFVQAILRSGNPMAVEDDDEVGALMMERMFAELPLRALAIFSGGKLRLRGLTALLRLFNASAGVGALRRRFGSAT